MSLESVKTVLRVPLNMLLVVLLLPILVIEYSLSALSMVASIGSLLRCDDKIVALKFIMAYKTGELLRAKFPNSIAVRS